MDPATLLIELLFAAIFAWAVRNWWRERDALSRDVVLVFSAMAAILGLGLLQLVIKPLPAAVSLAAVALLLGQPVFTLRVTGRIHTVPRLVIAAATIAWLATTIPFVIVGTSASALVALAAVAVFVLTEILAATYLAVAARRRRGAGAIRLWIAAAATALFALAIFAAGAGAAAASAKAASTQVALVFALLAAIGYLAAFVPPGPLRRAWQAQTAYAGLRELLAVAGSTPAAIWTAYVGLARQATAAGAAVVIEPGPAGELRVVIAAGVDLAWAGRVIAAGIDVSPGDARIDRAAALGVPAGLAEEARRGGATIVEVVALGGVEPAPRLILFHERASLFGEDDRLLLEALGQQAAGLAAQGRLAEQLEVTVGALRTASQAKSDFLASMSHELRTPLNAIIGFSDLMRQEPVDASGSVTVPLEWVEHIHRGGAHLVELVNDVLDLSKVEAGRLELDLEPIDVAAAVAESIAGLRPLIARKHLQVETDVAANQLVEADRGRLRQVLYNLLSNAIKFTPDGGRLGVEGHREGTMFHVTVSDTGIGIEPGDQARIFEEFQQVGAPTTEGTGLGLALTRRLVEAHGGRIELVSSPGEGSRFTVILPVAGAIAPMRSPVAVPSPAALAEPAPASPAEGPSTVRPRLLVVEDDPSAVRLLRAYLEPDGYDIDVAVDGERALAAAAASRPSAILLDVLLPGMDGWDVLRRLKADPDLREIPVVIVTVVEEREVGLALGAVDYLVKPIERDALLGALNRLDLRSAVPQAAVRVLAVDDEPAALSAIEAVLAPAGFEVTRALGGREGVEMATRDQPDLVICDLVMPDLDGFGVVGALRADPHTRDIPILILTGHDLTREDKQRLAGKVMAIVEKGTDAQNGLRAWLARTRPAIGGT